LVSFVASCSIDERIATQGTMPWNTIAGNKIKFTETKTSMNKKAPGPELCYNRKLVIKKVSN
jgi:hypothetical protein